MAVVGAAEEVEVANAVVVAAMARRDRHCPRMVSVVACEQILSVLALQYAFWAMQQAGVYENQASGVYTTLLQAKGQARAGFEKGHVVVAPH